MARMRARFVSPELFDDERVGMQPIAARLLFLGLMCLADHTGRLEDRPRRIKVDVLPYDDIDCESLLAGLMAAKLIRRYEDGGERYIAINEWSRWQSGHALRPGHAEWRALREAVFERDGHTCQYCGARGVRLECDHIIPVSRGGTSDLDNLAAACGPCNNAKNARRPDEWAKRQGDVSRHVMRDGGAA